MKRRRGGARQRTAQKSQWRERESERGKKKRESEIIEKKAIKTQCGSKDERKRGAKKDISRRQMGEEKAVTPKRETAWKGVEGVEGG